MNLGIEFVLDKEYKNKLKRLIAFRVVFAFLLLGSTYFVHLRQPLSAPVSPLLLFYGLIVFIFICSTAYTVAFYRAKNYMRLAYAQIGLDTFTVTILVYLSGGFDSSYSFLYPLISIYSSILLYRKGSLIISGLASIQYAALIGFEYFGITPPLISDWGYSAAKYHWSYVIYQVLIVVLACVAVSLLSSYLVEQTWRAKKEVKAMQDYVNRVDKMASLGEMAAGLAHEIKNPLASMVGSIQLLNRETFDDPDHQKLMVIVLREANRLSNLVNNFLLFAKSPEGQRQPVCLTDEIEETLMLIEKNEELNSRVDFLKELKPNLWVEMDPIHLRQILWNLLLNAGEAVGEHGRVIIRAIALKNNLIKVEIDDNGVGIKLADINRIFVPFFSSKPHGTGLGLSIVHNLLEGYHSRLDINSEPGRGTTVSFELKAIEKKA